MRQFSPIIPSSIQQLPLVLLLLLLLLVINNNNNKNNNHNHNNNANIIFCHGWITTITYTTNNKNIHTRQVASTTTSSSRKPPKQILFVNRNDNNNNDNTNNDLTSTDTSIGLNELHTQLRDAVKEENYIEAGRISDILYNRITSTSSSTSSSTSQSIEENKMTIQEKKLLQKKKMSWNGLDAVPWLVDRLTSLDYTFPTTIQINTMEAVNAILLSKAKTKTSSESSSSSSSSSNIDDNISTTNNIDMGIVISGTTGSGKTLAYSVPLLSTLSNSLYVRQRLRINDEEAVDDTISDLVDRITVVTTPVINSPSIRPISSQSNIPIAIGATMGRSGTDITSPLALIIVPTRELGIQTATILYQLVGGTITSTSSNTNTNTNSKQSSSIDKDIDLDIDDDDILFQMETTGSVAGKANNIDKYKGPKGIRIGCVLDDIEAEYGLKLQTDIAITIPKYLSKLLKERDIDSSKLRVIVYDEADITLEQTSINDLYTLFNTETNNSDNKREYSRFSYLVGASVTEAVGTLAVSSQLLPPGNSYIATATKFSPIISNNGLNQQNDFITTSTTTTTTNNSNNDASIVVAGTQAASLQDLNLCLYTGLQHQRVVISNTTNGLLVLTRLLRTELKRYEIESKQQPRVVIFFPDEASAKNAIGLLRDALWNEHRVCVLLPTIGYNPITIMDQFKSYQTSVMLATPNSIRGLDFPSVTHVYTLYLPINDPREYIHLAGRVGRVGQYGISSGIGGYVTSILTEGDDANGMNTLASTLGFTFIDIEPPISDIDTIKYTINEENGEIIFTDSTTRDEEKIEIEKIRRLLEDTISFVPLVTEKDESTTGTTTITTIQQSDNDIDDDNDDDDDDDEDDDDEFQ